MVVVYSDGTDMAAVDDTEAPTGSGAVHDGWANHFAAFGGQDVDKILLDYRHQRLGCTIIHVDDAGDEN